ncbi:MAG: hypothetical protein HY665_01075 [Chloroflexi bacterium]|nr:hypothetical protein [Chloroflexota bacterium]
MGSEALRNIRTMRQVKTRLDIARTQKTKTTNYLSRTKEEIERLEAISSGRTAQVLAKERVRSAAYDASVEKSRQRLLKSREKLANIINRNRALTQLRHELQQARWQKVDQPPSAMPTAKGETSHAGLRETELKY